MRKRIDIFELLPLIPAIAELVAEVRDALRVSSDGGRAITPDEAEVIGERVIGICRALLPR